MDRQKAFKLRAIEYKGGSCLICGYDSCAAAMDFHHINPEDKKFQISQFWSFTFEKITGELDKCVLLCCRCHREVEDGYVKLPDELTALSSSLALPAELRGRQYVYTPPPRDKANQKVLWDAVRSDSSRDLHRPLRVSTGTARSRSAETTSRRSGTAGRGWRVSSDDLHFGVREGRIGLNRMVELLATNPAKLFGLYPRKGTLPSARTPTSSSSTRKDGRRSRRRRITRGSTTPLRGNGGRRRRPRSCCSAEMCSSRAATRRLTGDRPVRRAGEVRRGARRVGRVVVG